MKKQSVLKPIIYSIIGISCMIASCTKNTSPSPESTQTDTTTTQTDTTTTQTDTTNQNSSTSSIDFIDSNTSFSISTIDSVTFKEKKIPVYQINFNKLAIKKLDSIKVGKVIYVPAKNGKGGVLVYVTDVKVDSSSFGGRYINKQGRISYRTGNTIIKGIQTTLDFFYNYDNASIFFTTGTNNAKKNSTYSNKISTNPADLNLSEISVTIKNDLFNASIGKNGKLFSFSGGGKIWKHGNSYLSLQGNFEIDPEFDFYAKFRPYTPPKSTLDKINDLLLLTNPLIYVVKRQSTKLGNMYDAGAGMYLDINESYKVKLHLEKSFGSKNLITIPVAKFAVPAGPISADFEVSFALDLKAAGVLDFEYEKTYSIEKEWAVHLNDIKSIPQWHTTKRINEDNSFTLTASIELEAGLKLQVSAEVYAFGFIGPKINTEFYLDSKIGVGTSVSNMQNNYYNWYMDNTAGAKTQANFNISLFHIDYLTATLMTMLEFKVEKNIYSAPHHIAITKGNDQTGSANTKLFEPVSVTVYDSRDNVVSWLPVPIFVEPASNSDGSVESSTVWTSDGKADINWTLGSKTDKQSLNIYLKNVDGSAKGTKLLAFAQPSTSTTPNDNKLKAIPTLPLNGVKVASSSVTLKWDAPQHTGNNTITYRLFLAEKPNPSKEDFKELVRDLNTTEYTYNSLSANINYSWKVVAVFSGKDNENDVSFTNLIESDVYTFTTGNVQPPNQAPSVPVLVSPANKATNQAIPVKLKWLASTDPNNDKLSYELLYGKNSPSQSKVSNISGTSHDLSGLEANTTYYWQVVADDGKGGTDTSSIYQFTTKEQVRVNSLSPTSVFRGKKVDFIVRGENLPSTLALWIGEILDGQSAPTSHSSTMVTFTATVPDKDGIIGSKKYIIKEKSGMDEILKTGFIQVTERPNQNPSKPQLSSPSNFAVNQPVSLSFKWLRSTDLDGDIITYDVYLDKSSTPSTIVSSNQSSPSYLANDLENGITYYWKVVAKDNKGAEVESDTWQFTTIEAKNQPPSQVTLRTPNNEQQNLSTSTTLEWNSSNDPDGSNTAIKYDIYLTNDLNNFTLLKSRHTSLLINTGYNGMSMNAATWYYWKVVAIDKDGARAQESEVRSFKVGGSGSNANSGLSWVGITNPDDGLRLSTKYHSSLISNGNKYEVDGWTSPTEAYDQLSCKADLYNNGSKVGPYQTIKASDGSWSKKVDLNGGVNEFYLSTGCNKTGRYFDNTKFKSNKRYLIFSPKPESFRAYDNNGKIKIQWGVDWTANYGTKTFYPYFKVWRNTIDATSGGTWKGITGWFKGTEKYPDRWSDDDNFYDEDVESGVTYYYFIQVSPYSNGAYASEYSNSMSANVR